MADGSSGLDEREVADVPLNSPVVDSRLASLTALAVTVAILVSLAVAREVLVPIALAILLTFMLAPAVRVLRRVGLGRLPAVVLAVLLALAVVLSLLGAIASRINDLVPDLPRYASTIDEKLSRVKSVFTQDWDADFSGLHRRLAAAGIPPAAPAPAKTGGPTPETHPMEVVVRPPDPTPLDVAQRILSPVLSPLATTGIVFVLGILFLLNQADLRDRFIRLLGMQDVHRTTLALDDAANRVSRYLLTQLCLNATFGVVIGLGLLLIGVPNPLLCGMLAALCRFVPYIGAIGSATLPLVLAASAEPGWSLTIWAASLLAGSELITGQLIEPLAFGRSTGLSPVAVVLAAIFWAWMWGPIGLIISTPLTVCLVVLGRHVRPLEFLDVLMGDRPALTPEEKFHQRILANDIDELQDQAEDLLRHCTIDDYYDNVLIKGLHLAAIDAERGVVTDAQLARIRRALSRLLDDVDPVERPLALPDPGESTISDAGDDGAVLCLSGRGPLDDVVAQLLVRRLVGQGVPARAVTFEAASRQSIATLDVHGVRYLCIAGLPASASFAHLRYLVRRLRRLLPDCPINVALLDAEDSESGDRIRSAVAADLVVNSLQGALAACLAGAGRSEPTLPASILP
jgi:predicted PurR-regulated permease PerM